MRPVAPMHGVFWLSWQGRHAGHLLNCRLFCKLELEPMQSHNQTSIATLVQSLLQPLLLSLLLALLFVQSAAAQHSHGLLTPGVTFPQDDSVLRDPPQMITMSFRVDVVLLKLALYTANDEWINIGFQYDPKRMHHSFVYPLPAELPESEYYVARWSVTDDTRRLVNGEFRFSFGPGAIPPSEVIASRVSDLKEVLPETGSYRVGASSRPD